MKNASGQAMHTTKVVIVSTRVQSLPTDFVYNPAKSFINKYKEIFCYNHSISLNSSVCLLIKNFFWKNYFVIITLTSCLTHLSHIWIYLGESCAYMISMWGHFVELCLSCDQIIFCIVKLSFHFDSILILHVPRNKKSWLTNNMY